jgi:hypothetical protein
MQTPTTAIRELPAVETRLGHEVIASFVLHAGVWSIADPDLEGR